MTAELTWLAAALVLSWLHIMITAGAKRRQDGMAWAAGPRDTKPPEYTGAAARLNRAQANLFETLPLFAAAILIAHVAGRESALTLWGARLFVVGRIVYVPLYAAGTRLWRTGAYFIATTGLFLVFVALF